MGPLIREPLVHFLVLGAVIFGLFAAFGSGPAQRSDMTLLEVTEDEAAGLARQFEATWRRPPTAAELEAMIDNYIRDEVLVREALALGLDQGDAVVRQRLVQKMQFLTESGAEAAAPDEAALQAHLDANAAIFARPARLAFDQVPFGDTAAARAALPALQGGADPAEFGVPSLLPARIPASPRQIVDGTFGNGFFDALAALPPGRWAGPVASGYGPHLVRVTEFAPRAVPPLDAIRDAVEADWRAEIRAQLREERLERLMSLYQVTRPDPAAVLAP
jgi:hypothetical protein